MVGGTSQLKTVYIYALNNGNITLQNKSEGLPFDIQSSGSTVYDDKLYVVGSRVIEFGGFAAVFNIYDYTWDSLPNLFYRRPMPPAVFVHQNTLFVLDGTGDGKQRKAIHTFNLTNHNIRWKISRDFLLPYDIDGHNAVVKIGEHVYIIGQSYKFSTSIITLNFNGTNTPSCFPGKDMTIPRHPQGQCVASDEKENVWVLGGCKNCWHDGFIEKFNTSSGQWIKLNYTPPVLSFIDMSAVGVQVCGYAQGFIYMIFVNNINIWGQRWGQHDAKYGRKHQQRYDSRFHIFNTMENTWNVSQTKIQKEISFAVSAVWNHQSIKGCLH